MLREEYLEPGLVILDFSPSRSLYRKLRTGPWDYTASDLSGDFISEASYDITRIPEPDERFDLILCYHVLEHVPEDQMAMRELFRVLKSEGTCLVQTPFREGEIYEDPSITGKEERKAYFGQEDHVRIYSAEGLKQRLEKAGFSVQIRKFEEETPDTGGLKPGEQVLVCSKSSPQPDSRP
jgi:ubiquinone/menaquinone biosynthesis C-methylase UbiE